MIKVGITGYEAKLDGKIDFFESDLISDDLNRIKHSSVLVSLNQFYYRHPHPVPLNERLESIESKIKINQTIGFSIKLTPHFFQKNELDFQIKPLIKELEKKFHKPVFVDLPKNASQLKSSKYRFSVDPLWVKPQSAEYWKIHGWHDSRWVRKYSSEQLQKLFHFSQKFSPHYIVFAHSQRTEQITEFLNLKSCLNP